ncbi:carbamoyl-phosphate synthase small subunit [Catalinimonas alkaloidigena]|uniref:Carbamoyl phosphate synthase small chain n=1 Tax=Catalinimonas alkaloidigena TaxID=1075417 RepID=A0A1G9NFX2_9BACT|nr:glutamine-hydrolyzing carbamoyl-phosphate synthase small subunit [Catalinimonas alkaloidigena]SDL85340.1 carbamoyl-phosphate synthase small subunit [Catalinimonas alkaloidigena]
MKYQSRQDALLVLEDGTAFVGKAIGKIGTTGGELCFNTGMTGYQEIYTDPSYYGQIIVNTTAHIGNYGVFEPEQESGSVKFCGLVCDEFASIYSRKRADHSLQRYLEEAGIVGISDVDTRKIVRYIRSKGAMNAMISSEILDKDQLLHKLRTEVPSMLNLELATQVSTSTVYDMGNPSSDIKVAVLDLGIKKSILKNLANRGVYCKVFPAQTPFQEMKLWEPNGYFISNGPGDPGVMDYAVDTVRDAQESGSPVFGICLGHQILARANGLNTYKMHHGHRGLNHPVKNLITGRCEVTSQNHGFGVAKDELDKQDRVEITHLNLNDQTVEGIRVKERAAFSVQYHPESSPGPHDSRYLFDEFIDNMQKS